MNYLKKRFEKIMALQHEKHHIGVKIFVIKSVVNCIRDGRRKKQKQILLTENVLRKINI